MLIGYGFLVASWVVPYVMRKQNNAFENRQKSHGVGAFLAAVSLVFFVSDLIIHLTK
jgi:hypothetical protein